MPNFPQYQNAQLVESANYRTTVLAGSAGAAVTAVPGDVVIIEVNAANVSGTATVTLPPVSLGGPVLVKFSHANANTQFGTAARVKVVPSVTDAAATPAVTIEGYTSITLQNLGDQAVFASDGVTWWTIDKNHNTIDSW